MNESKDVVGETEIHKFRQEYYKQIDFEYWQERLFTAVRRYNNLKSSNRKAHYIVEIYSIYIQVIEILLIHMHSLSIPPGSFVASLNISNEEIRKYAEKIVKNKKYQERFTHNFIYKIRGFKEIDKTVEDEFNRDIKILEECLKDYISEFNFLNSYKHGFRVTSTHGENYVAMGTAPENMTRIITGNSHLKYFEFARGELGKEVNEVDLTFNHMRIVGKVMFVIYMLINIRISILATYEPKKTIKYPRFYIYDEDAWRNDYGSSRFKSNKFILKKPSKSSK